MQIIWNCLINGMQTPGGITGMENNHFITKVKKNKLFMKPSQKYFRVG